MTPRWPTWLKLEWLVLAGLLIYPLLPVPTAYGSQLSIIFVFGILALGLNVVVGYAGLLHLGIAAFFGLGAYITGILTASPTYPFQVSFPVALVMSMFGAAAAGIMLGAPTLRLRGDYLAIVTLGFGEVVRFSLRNLEEITNGTRALGPIPPPKLASLFGLPLDWVQDYRPFYFLNLILLAVVVVVLKNLEASRLGRAWVAVREDELASTCMGLNLARVRLSSFAVGSALAGLAGCLYAVNQGSTAQPDSFDFNRSIMMLCCVILGGLGSLRGTLLGVFLLVGFDNVVAPLVDRLIQDANINPNSNALLTFSNWRLMIFGLALILMMRFRPEGLFPAKRVQEEMHSETPTQSTTVGDA
jgi:branched-chain amino acid transport system permease protein